MPEERKINTWQGIRDGVSIGTFIFCLGIFWQVASFVTKVNSYIETHKGLHQEIETKLTVQNNAISILRDWKVSVTQKPFYYDQEPDRASR